MSEQEAGLLEVSGLKKVFRSGQEELTVFEEVSFAARLLYST
jgi:hypothetical protein